MYIAMVLVSVRTDGGDNMSGDTTTVKSEETGYSDAMLPELNQEDIETAESVHCKSWVLRKLERADARSAARSVACGRRSATARSNVPLRPG